MRNGGEEARIVRGMCDVCVAHGDRATVSVDVDAADGSPGNEKTVLTKNF